MPTEFKPSIADKTAATVQAFLKSKGIDTDTIPTEIYIRNGEVIKIIVGNEKTDIVLTAQQITDIKAQYTKLDSHESK